MSSDQPAIAFPSSLEHDLRSCGVETNSNDTRELLGSESSKSNELSAPSGPKPTGITLYNIFHSDLNKIRKTTNQGVDIDIPYHSSSQNKRDNHSLLSTNINIWGSISSQDLSALVQLDLVINASALSLLQQLYIDVGMDHVNLRALFGLDLEPTCTYDMKETEEEIVVLYSMTKNLFQSYPHWGQMDEVIQSWYSRLPLFSHSDEALGTRTLDKKLWNEFYKSINIKVKLICPDASTGTEGRFHTSDVVESQMRLNEKPSMFDLIYPIHHDYLCCLPANYPSGHHDKSNLTSGVLEISKYSSAVPNFLPSNSMLIHYSDGSTRVHCELYNMLLRKGVISDTSKEKQEGETGISIYTKRFEDKAFDVLDEGVGYAKESVDIKVSTSLDPKENTRQQMVSMDFSEAHKHGNRGEWLQTKLCTDIADSKLCSPCEISSMSINERKRWSVNVEGDTCHKMMTDALRKEVELLRELNMVEKVNLDYDVADLAMVRMLYKNNFFDFTWIFPPHLLPKNVAEIKRLLQHVKLGETESKEIEKEISREQ
jgi:hypothetical protein